MPFAASSASRSRRGQVRLAAVAPLEPAARSTSNSEPRAQYSAGEKVAWQRHHSGQYTAVKHIAQGSPPWPGS